jgi:pimeloyl-ACP methyl ester carboxylesterase
VHAAASGLLPVSRVVLWEAPVSDEEWARENQRAYRRDLDALLAEDRREDAIARFMQMVGMPEEMIARARTSPWFAEAARTTAHSLAHDSDVLGDGSVPVDVASRVAVPALVLDGGGSPPFLREGSDALAAALPHAERRTLEGQTHAFTSDVMAAAVVDFRA